MHDEMIAQLAETPLFSMLDRVDLERLTSITHRQRYHKDQTVFYQGDPGTAMYVLVSGHVKLVLLSDGSESEVLVAILGPGEQFGELAVLDEDGRPMTAIAAEEAEVLAIYRDDLLAFLREHGQAAVQVARSLGLRLRRIVRLLADMAFLDLPSRLASCLYRLAGEERGKDGVTIRVTQEVLAEMVGATREAVNKQLGRLRALGLITTRRGRIRVVNYEKLNDLATLNRQ